MADVFIWLLLANGIPIVLNFLIFDIFIKDLLIKLSSDEYFL